MRQSHDMSLDSLVQNLDSHPFRDPSCMHACLSVFHLQVLLLLVIETSNYCNRNQLQHEMELQIGVVVEEMQNDTHKQNKMNE